MSNNYLVPQNDDAFEILDYKNLGQVRIQLDNQGNPWFCLQDVASVLGIQNSRDLLKRINEPYVDSIYIGVQTGVMADGVTPAMQNVPMNFINEAGLYQAIGQSRKPEAKKFMNWIFSEVIPEIRKKGYYSLHEIKTPKDFMHRLVSDVYSNIEMTQGIDNRLTTVENRLNVGEPIWNGHTQTINTLNIQQEAIVREQPLSVRVFMLYNGFDPNNYDLNTIGRECAKLCRANHIPISKIYHPSLGEVNGYPYNVLAEVVSRLIQM